MGEQESLVVKDRWLVHALSSYVAPLAPGDLLHTVSPGLLRSRLKELFFDLALPEGFQWYSLWRGGATMPSAPQTIFTMQVVRSRANLQDAGIFLRAYLRPGRVRTWNAC